MKEEGVVWFFFGGLPLYLCACYGCSDEAGWGIWREVAVVEDGLREKGWFLGRFWLLKRAFGYVGGWGV